MSRLAFILVLLLILLGVAPLPVSARPPVVSPERLLFDALNRERASFGLPPLQWDDSLASAARQHAERMAERNTLSHQLPGEQELRSRAAGAGARFSAVAENVAVGPDPSAIHSEWMRSPGHRANILSPQLSVVGIAVVPGAVGLFAVQDFSQAVPALSLERQEQQVISLLAGRGLQIISSGTGEARNSCEQESRFAANRPALVARYETADLAALPAELEQRLQSGAYRAAAVGACYASNNPGFSRFRIAILLY